MHLKPFPRVDRPFRFFEREYSSLEALHEHFLRLPMRPLLVSASLGSPYVPADPDGRVHLDGLLAYALVALIQGQGVTLSSPDPERPEGWVVPLPLRLLWISPEGLPLWAAGDLYPFGSFVRGRTYLHRRFPGAEMEWSTRKNANTSAGRWKEARVLTSYVHAREVRALAIGHPGWVRHLLREARPGVGKWAAKGFGQVLEWEVYETNEPEEDFLLQILGLRNLPLDYWMEIREGLGRVLPSVIMPRVAWTPPYWYAPYHGPGLVPLPFDPGDYYQGV